MSTLFAELNSRLYLDLDIAAEFLDLDKIQNAIIQRHNVRAAQSRFSDVNVLLSVSDEFTPTDSIYDITSLIGTGIPMWVEYRGEDDNSVTGYWYPLRVVPLAQLSDYRTIGVMAVAFEGQESSNAQIEPAQILNFSFTPAGTCRIRFDRDSTRIGLTDNILLPDHVGDLIVKEAEQIIIPRVKLAIAMRMRRDEELRKIANSIIAALDDIKAQNKEVEIPDLISLWEVWAFRARDGQVNFTKPTPSGKSLYGTSGGYAGDSY